MKGVAAVVSIGVFPVKIIVVKSNVIDIVDISTGWAASSFEMDEHCRKGAKHHAAVAVALEVFCLMRTSVL